MMNKTLSSPNTILWEYFTGLRRLVSNISAHSQKEQKQEIAISIFLAVMIVETFLNVYFRIIVDEAPFIRHREQFLKELEKRNTLDYKIKNWPKNILGKNFDLTRKIGEDFMSLKEKRNRLMHFVSLHEELLIENNLITGLTDISIYESLSFNDAKFALQTAEGVLEEIFRCRGIKEEDISGMMHGWTGKVPTVA